MTPLLGKDLTATISSATILESHMSVQSYEQDCAHHDTGEVNGGNDVERYEGAGVGEREEARLNGRGVHSHARAHARTPTHTHARTRTHTHTQLHTRKTHTTIEAQFTSWS